MSRIPNVRRIIVEDYDEDDQELISGLSYNLNSFMENVTDVINGGIDFDNLDQNKMEFELTVDSSGKPVGNDVINTQKVPTGLQVIKAVNLTNGAIFPTGSPFISYSNTDNNKIKILNASNLQANNKYKLTIVVY